MVKVFQTEDIHAIAVRSTALVVECIDATDVAKEMASSVSMELIFCEFICASEEFEVVF